MHLQMLSRVRFQNGQNAMIKFVGGKSYLWLFPVFLVAMLVSTAFCFVAFRRPLLGSLALPITMGYFFVCQWKSGIALDSKWTAKYPNGTWQFRCTMICGMVGTIAFLIGVVFAIISVGFRSI